MLASALSFVLLTKQVPYTEIKDIVYKTVGSQQIMLDVAYPNNAKSSPVIMLIHGGGWVAGSRGDMASLVPGLVASGYACVNIEYRLAPAAQYPAQIEDVKASVRWIKDHATQYRLNKNKIAAFGMSAGGHLTALLAATGNETQWDLGTGQTSKIQAAISYAGPTDFPTWWKNKKFQPPADRAVIEACLPALLGGTYEQVPQMYVDASPVSHVTPNCTPTMFLHGDVDTLVPKAQSQIMYNLLVSKSVTTEILIMPGVGHGGFGNDPGMVFSRFLAFLKNNLK